MDPGNPSIRLTNCLPRAWKLGLMDEASGNDGRRKPLIILGAGGHARVCVDAARRSGREIRGFIDPAFPVGSEIAGVPVLGECAEVLHENRLENGTLFVAIGDNRRRFSIQRDLRRQGLRLATLVDPAATVSPGATLGEGVVVMPAAVINAEAVVGSGAIVNTGAIVEHGVHVGEAAHIAPGACVTGECVVGSRALIGAGATLIPGISVGTDAIVGAGAVVTRDVLDDWTVGGIPARSLRALKVVDTNN